MNGLIRVLALPTVIAAGLTAAAPASADAGQHLRTQSGRFDCAVFASYPGTGPGLKVFIAPGSYAMCAPRTLSNNEQLPWFGLAVVDSAGNFSIKSIEGPPPSSGDLVMSYGNTYNFCGWTISANQDGTRFTNDRTGHGMFVSRDNVYPF